MEGRFGNSLTKKEAQLNKLYVTNYSSNKDTIELLDNRKVIIGESWAEKQWTYHNGKPKIAHSFGYSLHLEFIGENEDFVFQFDIPDGENKVFTRSLSDNECVLHPKHLFSEIKVILEEKNPIDTVGWRIPIITDTIILTKTTPPTYKR